MSTPWPRAWTPSASWPGTRTSCVAAPRPSPVAALPDQAAPHRVRLAADAFGVLDDTLREALLAVADLFGADGMVALVPDDQTLEDLTRVVRDVQGPEFAALHRAWIESAAPTFGEGVGERIAHALAVSEADHARAVAIRDRLQAHVATVLAPGDLVLLPAAGPPPRREATAAVVADARRIAASLSVVGSLAGLPTVTIPALVVDGAPVGLSVLAPCRGRRRAAQPGRRVSTSAASHASRFGLSATGVLPSRTTTRSRSGTTSVRWPS